MCVWVLCANKKHQTTIRSVNATLSMLFYEGSEVMFHCKSSLSLLPLCLRHLIHCTVKEEWMKFRYMRWQMWRGMTVLLTVKKRSEESSQKLGKSLRESWKIRKVLNQGIFKEMSKRLTDKLFEKFIYMLTVCFTLCLKHPKSYKM